MDSAVEIWRAQIKNPKQESPVPRRCRKHCIGDLGVEDPKAASRSDRIKAREEDNDVTRQKSWWSCLRKTKSPSIMSLTKSASANCCTCCCVLAAYVKEVFRFLLRCPADSRVSDLFAEVLKISGCVCNDCCNILKGLFTMLFVIRK